MRTYEHSGIVPLGGALMTTAAGCLAAMFLGVAYVFTFYYIPFVYLNLLFVLVFGGGVGYAVGRTARAGKIRSVTVVGALALVTALVGIYCEWGATAYAMMPMGDLKESWSQAGLLPWLPQNIFALMQYLYAEGSWGITRGSAVHGLPLAAFWLIESGLVLFVAIATAVNQVLHRPFCERCDKWIENQAPHLYVGDGSEQVWTQVQQGTFETLAFTPRATGEEPAYVRLTLSVCEGCCESNYLTITACQNATDNKGNTRLEQRDLVNNLVLEPAQVAIIQAANTLAPAPDTSVADAAESTPAADSTDANL